MSEHADGVFWAKWTSDDAREVFLIEHRGREWCGFGSEDYYLDEYVESNMVIVAGPLSPPTPIADVDVGAGKTQRAGRPWLDNDKTIPELHVGGWEYDVRVCVGTDNVVEIDKSYGSLVARAVRVSIVPEWGAWVVEREVDVDDPNPDPGTRLWVECARFPLEGDIR